MNAGMNANHFLFFILIFDRGANKNFETLRVFS